MQRTLTIAGLLAALSVGVRAASPPALSVGVLLHQNRVLISSSRGMKVIDPRTRGQLDVRFGASPVLVTATLAGLHYPGKGIFPALWVQPTPGSLVSVNGRSYRGVLELKRDGGGAQNVVNLVDVESYLLGVVKAEMSATAPLHALAAQAITARTYAIRNRDTFRGRGYGLKANEQSQVYMGVAGEDPRTMRAVRATRGVVITHQGRPIEALFHAACGGRTENNEDVWEYRPQPYERSVACWGCRARPPAAWSASFDLEAIARRLKEFNWPTGNILDLEFTFTKTDRIKDVIVRSTSGDVVIPGNTFRIIVDRRAIKSLRFARRDAGVEIAQARMGEGDGRGADDAIRAIIGGYLTSARPRRLSLVGIGSGHGVGLCQWGAQAMAQAGRSFAQIIHSYYTGVELRRIY